MLKFLFSSIFAIKLPKNDGNSRKNGAACRVMHACPNTDPQELSGPSFAIAFGPHCSMRSLRAESAHKGPRALILRNQILPAQGHINKPAVTQVLAHILQTGFSPRIDQQLRSLVVGGEERPDGGIIRHLQGRRQGICQESSLRGSFSQGLLYIYILYTYRTGISL